jgi:hypothetical protein
VPRGDECTAEPLRANLMSRVIDVAMQAVSEHLFREIWQDAADIRFVGTDDAEAIERHFIQELLEGRLDFLKIPVKIEVLAVDGGHDGHHRVQFQKRPVALVRLRHHELPLAELGVAPQAIEAPTDH